MTGRVLVVADDLTGANDTGVQFAEAGWNTTLRLGGGDATLATPARQATAVSTDARALAPDAASDVTQAAIAREGLTGGDHLYLKIDSTLRGSVAGQVAGALAARRATVDDAVVVLCPAYPAMGRTVTDGRLLVHGRPVSASPAGRDPVTPVRHDTPAELVPGSIPLGTYPNPALWAEAIDRAALRGPVVAVDAHTDEDLAGLAAAIELLGPRAVPAGSAGLAAPLAALWGEPEAAPPPPPPSARRPLILVSSHHAVAREQVVALAAADDSVAVVHTESQALLRGEGQQLPAASGPVVLLSPQERSVPTRPADLAAALADRAATWLRHSESLFDGVVLVGGDGAEAFLAAIGAHGIAVRGRLLEGVPDGRVAGGEFDGLTVVTKAGGFGDGTTLNLLVRALRIPIGSETTQ